MLYDGYGVERDRKNGIGLVKKAANLGHQDAAKILPTMSLEKFDLLVYLNRATKGDVKSMISLGWNYLKGGKSDKDKVESYAWFNLAAKLTGENKNIWVRSFIAEQLDVEQIIKGKRRSNQIAAIYGLKEPSEK